MPLQTSRDRHAGHRRILPPPFLFGFLLSLTAAAPSVRANDCGLACWCKDLNGDGAVDFCDQVMLSGDLANGNPRSDFNDDDVVNLTDVYLFHQCYPSGPQKVAAQGAATIGVYFDEAGTISRLNDVPAFTWVDVYIVAHGVTDPAGIGGYMFRLDNPSPFPVISETPPAGFTSFDGHDTTTGRCVRATLGACLAPAPAVILTRYRVMFFGGQDLVLGLTGMNRSDAPSQFPSYLGCCFDGLPCEWTYFDPAALGRAVINPSDFNHNGLADVFEAGGTRFYHITGASTGIPWSVGIREAGGSPSWSYETTLGPLATGAPASAFVDAFVGWLNGLGPQTSIHAESLPWSSTNFSLTVAGGTGFELGVGAAPGSPDCWAASGNDCEFNPVLSQNQDPAASVPDRDVLASRNHPNPFNPLTVITFDLPVAARVELRVYDLGGRLVRTLLDGRHLEAGPAEAAWDGRDDQGNALGAGVYLYRLVAGELAASGRMALVK